MANTPPRALINTQPRKLLVQTFFLGTEGVTLVSTAECLVYQHQPIYLDPTILLSSNNQGESYNNVGSIPSAMNQQVLYGQILHPISQHYPSNLVLPKSYGPFGANLFIFHIPQEWTDAHLYNNFREFGTIISCNINKDKHSGRQRGYDVYYDYLQNGCDLARAEMLIQRNYGLGGAWPHFPVRPKFYLGERCNIYYLDERYCIVTNLEDKKKCFWCDSRLSYSGSNLSHRIENVVPKSHSGSRKHLWWQSQNGVENVTIQLNLESEFHFTHLYMKFKTFRPAAMLIERSYDFEKTWKVYRYLAYDCGKYFSSVPKGPQSNLTTVYCDETYSAVTPITDGEVILKILPTTLEAIDPYSNEVQNLVKITNLRVNFTKLHTLGDDLLDSRVEIQEKYYYAIWEIIVGGSCSCYGHADRCMPREGVESKPNMVHGQCECTHNTKGLNCEKCDDFYNDVDWAPAVGKQTNACKRCNCNNHATSCHFDKSVFESTGRISGGVCDDCQHNTMGRNCEQCKHFFYQDTNKDFSAPDVCLRFVSYERPEEASRAIQMMNKFKVLNKRLLVKLKDEVQ